MVAKITWRATHYTQLTLLSLLSEDRLCTMNLTELAEETKQIPCLNILQLPRVSSLLITTLLSPVHIEFFTEQKLAFHQHGHACRPTF